MSEIEKYLAEFKVRAAAAKPRRFFRVAYPPSDYSGDEWDLLRMPTQDFESRDTALAFAETKKNKRVPDWGQPRVWPVVIGHEMPFRVDAERLAVMLEAAIYRLGEYAAERCIVSTWAEETLREINRFAAESARREDKT